MVNEDWYELFLTHMWSTYGSSVQITSQFLRILMQKDVWHEKFHFDKRWLSKPNFELIVRLGWLTVRNGVDPVLGERIANCRAFIPKWRKNEQLNSSEAIEDLKTRLEEEKSSDLSSVEEITGLQDQLRAALVEEEVFWHQKSCVTWYKEGDQNTKIFNVSTKQQRARNNIIGILNDVGVWTEKEEEIEQIATTYFHEIFSSSAISDLEVSLQYFPSSVVAEMNNSLLWAVSAAEVKAAVFAIHPEKAPGPDGMTALFYQKFWHLIRS